MFEPLGAADRAVWLARSRARYIEERVASGDTPAEATAMADASLQRMFPDGSPAPGQMVGRVTSQGAPVGFLWIGPLAADPVRWWVWEIEVSEPERGRGYGRRAMLLAESLARAHGATSIGLSVFARNTTARHLYTSLGYAETSVQMRKALDPPAHRD